MQAVEFQSDDQYAFTVLEEEGEFTCELLTQLELARNDGYLDREQFSYLKKSLGVEEV